MKYELPKNWEVDGFSSSSVRDCTRTINIGDLYGDDKLYMIAYPHQRKKIYTAVHVPKCGIGNLKKMKHVPPLKLLSKTMNLHNQNGRKKAHGMMTKAQSLYGSLPHHLTISTMRFILLLRQR